VRSSFWQIVVLTVAVLGSGVGLAYTHHVNRQLFVQWQQWELLQLEQSTLVTEVAVEETARTRLNMLIPDPGQVLYIPPYE